MTKPPVKKPSAKASAKSSAKAKPASKAAPTARANKGAGRQVNIGMYGLARILKAIHGGGPEHERNFIADLSQTNKHVAVDPKTFDVMKRYASSSPVAAEMDNCGSDPYDICFGRHSSWDDVSGS